MECHLKHLFLYRNNNILVLHYIFNIYLHQNSAPKELYLLAAFRTFDFYLNPNYDPVRHSVEALANLLALTLAQS